MTISVTSTAAGPVWEAHDHNCELCDLRLNKKVPAEYDALIPRRCCLYLCEPCFTKLPEPLKLLAVELRWRNT